MNFEDGAQGAPLEGRWEGFRFALRPWMLIIYAYDETEDRMDVVTIQDARRRARRNGGLVSLRRCEQQRGLRVIDSGIDMPQSLGHVDRLT